MRMYTYKLGVEVYRIKVERETMSRVGRRLIRIRNECSRKKIVYILKVYEKKEVLPTNGELFRIHSQFSGC